MYQVCLTVIKAFPDSSICIADTCKWIQVFRQSEPDPDSNCYLFIPNVFTPNGDGINELFLFGVTPNCYQSIETQIFNRWGNKIYHTLDPEVRWNGRTSSNRDVPEGVYTFISKIVYLSNQVEYRSRTVTLIR